MAVFHVVISQSGPEWNPALPLEQQSGWDEHAAFMDGLVAHGLIVLGGPIGNERRVVHVVEADSDEDVRTAFAADPWHESHLHIEAIEPWTLRLDSRGQREGA